MVFNLECERTQRHQGTNLTPWEKICRFAFIFDERSPKIGWNFWVTYLQSRSGERDLANYLVGFVGRHRKKCSLILTHIEQHLMLLPMYMNRWSCNMLWRRLEEKKEVIRMNVPEAHPIILTQRSWQTGCELRPPPCALLRAPLMTANLRETDKGIYQHRILFHAWPLLCISRDVVGNLRFLSSPYRASFCK